MTDPRTNAQLREDCTTLEAEITRLRAELVAAREQVAGAYLAAAETAYLWHDDDDAQELRETIRALTTAEATAALEARDARVRAGAEQKWRDLAQWAYDTLEEINPSNYDHDDACRVNAASVEVILALGKALHTPESRAAQPIEESREMITQEHYDAADKLRIERLIECGGCFAPPGSICDETHCECAQIAFDEVIDESRALDKLEGGE